MNAAVLKLGERVMLIDAKDRHYLITLREGAEFHTTPGSSSTTTSLASSKDLSFVAVRNAASWPYDQRCPTSC